MAAGLDPEALLVEAAWLKRLAVTLAGDADDADDLVQESWIAAWRRAPDTSRPLRPWLGKVLRDESRMRRRADARRTQRETAAAGSDVASGPDELLDQVRLHKALVDLVLELDEPYRSTVLARYVDGQSSAAIAKRLGVAQSTVRWRLHEALARLRTRLDEINGERTAWAPAVLAFAKGGIHVAKPTKVLLAVLVALLLLGAATVVKLARPGSHGQATLATKTNDTMTSSARPSEAVMSSGTLPADASTTVVSPDARAARRAAMLEAIARARSHRMAVAAAVPHAAASATTGDSTGTTLDITDKTGDTSDWSKRALGTLNSLLGQCYDLGRAEDPAFAGTIEVRFTLVGEPGVGGVLESVEIVDKGTSITQPTFRDCVTQQLYALELDPPPEGVTVRRQITLNL